ncbi:hypothetical protein Leryth_025903 [Lithospermum erythrorhizon]|nr:hypothetical protein Leryth_025903 [Lithospermum erythrorhizon]
MLLHVWAVRETSVLNSSKLDSSKRVGLWRTVVVHNLPYTDPRRNGKIPKLLLHRIFPNARYSLWIDGKLELVVDPYLILERFLWRKNASFAISRHYRRFDVFVEAEANKAAGKYENSSIDFQIEFYKKEGLTPYSVAKLPITSGPLLLPDQISFSTVRDKIRSKTNWTFNMFLDCERRNFVVQGYHRDVLENWAPPPPPPLHLATTVGNQLLPNDTVKTTNSSTEIVGDTQTKRSPGRRGGEKKSRRHRKVGAGKDL